MKKNNRRKSRGGGIKCPAKKPICVKINNNKQKQNCKTYKETENSNPLDEMTEAYEIMYENKGEDDDVCDHTKRDGKCFCANFDYVWLTNIREIKNRVDDTIKTIDNEIKPLSMTSSTIEDIQKDITTNFSTSLDFPITVIQKYIDMAEKIWKRNDENNDNIEQIIKTLKKTLHIVQNRIKDLEIAIPKIMEALQKINEESLSNKSNKESPVNDLNAKEIIIQCLDELNSMFDIGKYFIIDSSHIDDAATGDILSQLETIQNIFSPFPESTGGYKKTRRNKGKNKKKNRTRKIGGVGGKVGHRGKRFLFGVLFIIVGAIILSNPFSAAAAALAVGLIFVIPGALTFVSSVIEE
jgi:hypothetical protein